MTDIRYQTADDGDLTTEELAAFIEKMDESLINPIGNRDYFESYQSLAEKFLSGGWITYCRDASGTLIGAAVCYADPRRFDFAYETYIGVLPSYQNLGIAETLMTKEISYCQSRGMKGFMTNCSPANEKKMNLNRRLGLQEMLDPVMVDSFTKMNPKWRGKVFYIMRYA